MPTPREQSSRPLPMFLPFAACGLLATVGVARGAGPDVSADDARGSLRAPRWIARITAPLSEPGSAQAARATSGNSTDASSPTVIRGWSPPIAV